MIKARRQRFGIPYTYIWFADRPSRFDALKPVVYMHCGAPARTIGFLRKTFFTRLIDLSQTEEALLKAMSRNTSYKIKRAMREGVVMVPVTDLDTFIKFYNTFAASKGRSSLTRSEVFGWRKDTIGLAAIYDGRPLVMHSYIIDAEAARGRLLHSASHFRDIDNTIDRNFVGRANRYLHFAAMLYFKSLGLRCYDLGGYAVDTEDQEKLAIARFKEGFGGTTVRDDHLVSLPMAALRWCAHTNEWIRRFGNSARPAGRFQYD